MITSRIVPLLRILWSLPLLLAAAEDPAALSREGARLLADRQPQAAIAPLKRSLELRPNDAGTAAALGVAYSSLGDYVHAEEPFHRACLLKPLLPDACLYFGRTLYLLDRFEPALDVLRRAQTNEPRNGEIYRVEALCLEALGRVRDAEAAFREAISLSDGGDASIDYGVFLYRQGRAEEALAPLRTAVDRHPEMARGHLELGCTLLELDRLQDAVRQLELAVKLDPKLERARMLLEKARRRL